MAYNKDLGKRMKITSPELTKDAKEYTWICQNCIGNEGKDSTLTVIQSFKRRYGDSFTKVVTHFRHKKGLGCDSEQYSYQHIFMEEYFEYFLPKYNDIKLIELERVIKTDDSYRKADIYLELKTGERIVVEVQHSPISEEELIKRTQDYNSQNIYVMWVIDNFSTGFKEYYMRTHFVKAYHIFISPRGKFEPDEKTDIFMKLNERERWIISDLKIQWRERNGFKCAEFSELGKCISAPKVKWDIIEQKHVPDESDEERDKKDELTRGFFKSEDSNFVERDLERDLERVIFNLKEDLVKSHWKLEKAKTGGDYRRVGICEIAIKHQEQEIKKLEKSFDASENCEELRKNEDEKDYEDLVKKLNKNKVNENMIKYYEDFHKELIKKRKEKFKD
jgi:hypothetical protein